MYGAGVNLQQSHTMIFAGIGFKFARRSSRPFTASSASGSSTPAPCTSSTPRPSARSAASSNASGAARRARRAHDGDHPEYGLGAHLDGRISALDRLRAPRRRRASATSLVVNNDCVDETRAWRDSVGLIVTSIPFSHQYEYSPELQRLRAHRRQRALLAADGLPHAGAPARAAARARVRRAREGPDHARRHQRLRLPDRDADLGPVRRSLRAPRLRLPRAQDDRHGRRAREQPDLPPRLDRAMQGRLAHGRGAPRVRAPLPEAADGSLERLRRPAGGRRKDGRRIHPRRAGSTTPTASRARAATAAAARGPRRADRRSSLQALPPLLARARLRLRARPRDRRARRRDGWLPSTFMLLPPRRGIRTSGPTSRACAR
jgi:hypothetical protein